MGQGDRDQQLLEALLEAGLKVKAVEIRSGKKVVTVEKMETKIPESPLEPVLYAVEIPTPRGF